MSIKKIILILVCIGIFVSLFFLINRGVLEINLSVSADIKIDKSIYRNRQVLKKNLLPKKYKITISKNSYIDYEIEVDIKRWEKKRLNIELSLVPKITKISDDEISYPYYKNGQVLALAKNRSSIYKINLSTNKKEEINTGLNFISGIRWSPDAKKAILTVTEFEKPENKGMSEEEEGAITNWYFNIETKELKQLPLSADFFAWMPDSKKIIYFYFDSGNYYLNISEPNGNNPQKITTNINNLYEPFIVPSSNSKKIAIYSTPLLNGSDDIYVVNIENKEVKKITDGYETGAVWSPDANKILYTYLESSNRPFLWTISADGSNKKDLGLVTTSAPIYKAIFSSDNKYIYAAVPKKIPQNFFSTETKTEDELWKIDLENNIKIKLADTDLDIEKMMFSEDGKVIYFISNTNLYSAKIKE